MTARSSVPKKYSQMKKIRSSIHFLLATALHSTAGLEAPQHPAGILIFA
jgi:hypothetical protein